MLKITMRPFKEADFKRDQTKHCPIVSGQSEISYFVIDVYFNDIYTWSVDLRTFNSSWAKNDVLQFMYMNTAYTGEGLVAMLREAKTQHRLEIIIEK